MRTIGKSILAAAVVLAVLAGGCGDEKCPTEPPEVDSLARADCTVATGQRIDYPIQLCPTCNQTLSSCDVQISGGDIFLNPVVETCESAASCGPGCNLNPTTCTFTAPAPGSYTVTAFDAAHPDTLLTSPLTVVETGPTSCELAASG